MSELIRQFKLQNVHIIDARQPYSISATPATQSDNQYSSKINQTSNADRELYKSSLGTPVLTNLQFTGMTWQDQNGKTQSFKTLIFDAILITVNQSSDVVKTNIQGRKTGSVKEYIGEGDHILTINGIITGPNGHYPIDEVRDLKRMLNAGVAIEVVSWYLQNLDISSIVITDKELAQEEGGYSYQKFSLSALSDTPQEIQIFN